jgi:hypothetical protein
MIEARTGADLLDQHHQDHEGGRGADHAEHGDRRQRVTGRHGLREGEQ